MHERWLHARRSGLRQWGEQLEEALAAVDALEAAGAIDAAEAAGWRDRFARDARGERKPPEATPEQRAAAEALLTRLLAAGEEGEDRFDGALEVFAAAGAADRETWDRRMREAYGWPTREEELAAERALNAGGTNADLVAVLPGPEDRCAGRRVLYALRFADGMVFVIDDEATGFTGWPEWRLTDDRGTPYDPGGGGGGGGTEEATFRTAPPPDATWVELALMSEPAARFRIAL